MKIDYAQKTREYIYPMLQMNGGCLIVILFKLAHIKLMIVLYENIY